MKYTKDNNVLMATIHFMNEANYQNAISGVPAVWAGVTGQLLKEKQRKIKQGIPIQKLHIKTRSGLTPEVGMRYPEKRTGRRFDKAQVQLNNKES